MCPVEVCENVRVCEWTVPCDARPIDDIFESFDTFETLDTLPPFDPLPFDALPFDADALRESILRP
jgi:hypothetical protein